MLITKILNINSILLWFTSITIHLLNFALHHDFFFETLQSLKYQLAMNMLSFLAIRKSRSFIETLFIYIIVVYLMRDEIISNYDLYNLQKLGAVLMNHSEHVLIILIILQFKLRFLARCAQWFIESVICVNFVQQIECKFHFLFLLSKLPTKYQSSIKRVYYEFLDWLSYIITHEMCVNY